MTPPLNRGGGPSRPLVDPVTLEPAGWIVEVKTACRTCGRGALMEVFTEEGRLARREAHGQLCWHYRASQSDPVTPSDEGGLTKLPDGGILKHGRR